MNLIIVSHFHFVRYVSATRLIHESHTFIKIVANKLQIIYLIGGGRSGESALLLRVTSGRASRQPRRATDFGRLVECLLQSRGQHFLSADEARGPFSRAIRALDEPDDEHDGHERARRE